jgi:predicted transcriptional regulator
MYRQVEWMKPADDRILRELANYGGWMKASSLHLNLGFTGQHVARRCRALADHDLLDRHPETSAYRINDFGRRYLDGDLAPENLE